MAEIGIVARLTVTLACCILCFQSATCTAQEIGFLEDFALAEDRAKVLKKLVPGTQDYYLYHCLHLQHTQQLDQVERYLGPWIKRYGYTEQVNQIRNRQALLKYGDDPQETLDYLAKKLNLNFNHQREIPQTQRDLPSKLDPNLIETKRLIDRALSRYSNTDGFDASGLWMLADRQLNKTQLRHLLQRLQYPDYPNLVTLIIRDLKERDSKKFGSMPIHHALTLSQLDELASQSPRLKNTTDYVNIYMTKLRPSADTNWRVDTDAHQQYLDRLWKFASQLEPVHNSLKASILYHKLQLNRKLGLFDQALFLEYLQLPRQVGYVPKTIVQNIRNRSYLVDLNKDYSKQTLLTPIRNDETLVRELLQHYLVQAATVDEFRPFIETNYLKRQFATAKIVNGLGDSEQWASMLSPEQYRKLIERVDLDFLPTNPEQFGRSDDVRLELNLKNVKTLLVKMYEINTENYYQKFNSEIDTNINLDGLVPNFEQTFSYDEAPALRVKRSFDFPQFKERGVYVVDFIAGGKSSRALIRKGRLQMVHQVSAAGQLFTVLDQTGAVVDDASLWISGRRYHPTDGGRILIPFSTQPKTSSAIIRHGDFSCLQSFEHVAEEYEFDLAMVLDRESLSRSNRAKIVLRPLLRIKNGSRVPLSLLKDSELVLTTINQDGISATKPFSDLKLSDEEESVCEFVVPPRLSQLKLNFSASIQNLSKGKTESIGSSAQYSINEIDKSSIIQDIHLLPTSSGYLLEALGKTGEPRMKQALRVTLKIRGLKDQVDVDLQSDSSGKISLGKLENVESITAKLAGGSQKAWFLPTSDQAYPASIHATENDSITIVSPSDLNKPDKSRVSLFSVKDGTFIRDFFDSVSIADGMLRIKSLPAGDYLLRLNYQAETSRQSSTAISIKVTDGEKIANVLVGDYRLLENRFRSPLQIAGAKANQNRVEIQLANFKSNARVHLIATRYQPAFNAFQEFSRIRDIEPWSYRPSVRRSAYVEGRKIGDEYQYILDRKFATKFPGNMLDRPSLLLDPWTNKTTNNKTQAVDSGDEFGRAGNDADPKSERKRAKTTKQQGKKDFASLDFVVGSSWSLNNLKPDENGRISVDRSQLGNAQHIRIIAVDDVSTLQRSLDMPLGDLKRRDGRLAKVLDQDGHYSQRKRMDVLAANDELRIEDIVSAKFKYYDDLGDVFVLLSTLNPDTQLSKFDFILEWPDLPEQKRLELYSKYACHELNFYLSKKDPEFFSKVIKRHLQNKKEKTFIDRWLLKEKLDEYASPWKYARLNTFEKILLAQRLESRAGDIIKNIHDQYALNPTTRSQFDVLYDTSIGGLSFDDDGLMLRRESLMEGNGLISAVELRNSERRLGRGPVFAGEGGGSRGRSRGGRALAAPSAGAGASLGVSPMQTMEKSTDRFFGVLGEQVEGKMTKGIDLDMESIKEVERRIRQVPVTQYRTERRQKRKPDGTVEWYEERVPYTEMITESFEIPVRDGLELYGYFDSQKLSELRRNANVLYRRLPPTQEWIESQYYRLSLNEQTPELIQTNRFWRDYADHQGGSFLSRYLAEPHRNFSEIMFALAVLDLPLKSPEQELEYVDSSLQLKATSPVIVFHQQVQDAIVERGNTTVLISENFFQANDRYRYEDGVRFDKFVNDEFNDQTLYGGQVVITNPTSTPRAVDLLIQIPQGSVACNGSQDTKTVQLDLKAFSTRTFEYYFYFPAAGNFSHYPAHVSAQEKVLAVADQVAFIVTDQPAELDKSSWDYVSQNGSDEEVIEFLNQQNILRLDLERIAFRMQDSNFFGRAIKTLRNRYVYSHLLWSYAVRHNDQIALQEFLSHADEVSSQCGPYFQSDLLTVNPEERHWYQHKEYWPLVNARVHQLGARRKILNPDFFRQYRKLLAVLSHCHELDHKNRLVITYYLLLQDRIDLALKHFETVDPKRINNEVQYAYCDAYLAMYREQPDVAAKIAEEWADYPVMRWQNRFKNIVAQVKEINGSTVSTVNEKDQLQKQTALASKSQSFEFTVESNQIQINYRNLDQVKINYYDMDIELLFSRSPFAQDELDGFSLIRPNHSQTVDLPSELSEKQIELPESFRNQNILVEVVAGDQAKSLPYFAHSMDVQTAQNYGQLQAFDKTRGKALSKVYVKVYAKRSDGSVKFLKDGYTDLRGRFDYVSQSNHPLGNIKKLSVLLMSPDHGAVIKQLNPPNE